MDYGMMIKTRGGVRQPPSMNDLGGGGNLKSQDQPYGIS